MTTKIFHLAMMDNTLHLIAIWYLLEHVKDQPSWFYTLCWILLVVYIIMLLVTMLEYHVSCIKKDKQGPSGPPKHP